MELFKCFSENKYSILAVFTIILGIICIFLVNEYFSVLQNKNDKSDPVQWNGMGKN